MAKRKRTHAVSANITKDSEYEDPKASKLQFNSHEDLFDSEDEFLRNREKILLDDKSDVRHRKQRQEEEEQQFLASPSEDALAQSSSASEDEDIDDKDVSSAEDQHDVPSVSAAQISRPAKLAHFEDEHGEENSDDMFDDWGPSASSYYDANPIQTEQDALDEEAEALRIQQRRLRALQESDFGFDEAAWAAQDDENDQNPGADGMEKTVFTEKLPQLHISSEMTSDQKMGQLRKHYPDFEPFARDLVELRPKWEELGATANKADKKGLSVPLAQSRALSAYLGSLAMYFAILLSPGQESDTMDADSLALPFPALDLRDHEIMQHVENCRRVWNNVKWLESFGGELERSSDDEKLRPEASGSLRVGEKGGPEELNHPSLDKNVRSYTRGQKENQAAAASRARRTARLRQAEATLADLDADLKSSRKAKPKHQNALHVNGGREDSDLGDEPALPEREAAEKARRKRSLRFYTSQIAQKENKRLNAMSGGGSALQGDEDLPQRERTRNRAAHPSRKRNEAPQDEDDDHDKLDDGGNGPTGNDTSAVHPQRQAMLNDDAHNDYAARLLHHVRSKKNLKRDREAAHAEARETGGQVVPKSITTDQQDGNNIDGRREIGFTIQKNRGLTPKRKKEVKNPRVKKRKRYEDKSKKLKSSKPTWQGGEGKGGYKGELTGIKKNLVKSVKL
ncbi:MAG: hypothetical protein M1831_005922 [Alyxoria varia]|nr:MAG: hypothetical protein M1831_005922 [Alyxoria varia]